MIYAQNLLMALPIVSTFMFSTAVAFADMNDQCIEKIKQAATQKGDERGFVVFNLERAADPLVTIERCKDGSCKHLFYAKDTGSIQLDTAMFPNAPEDLAVQCDGQTMTIKVYEPAAVESACEKAVMVGQNEIYVLRRNPKEWRLLKHNWTHDEESARVFYIAAKEDNLGEDDSPRDVTKQCKGPKIKMATRAPAARPVSEIGAVKNPLEIMKVWREGMQTVGQRGDKHAAAQGVGAVDISEVATEAVQILGQIVVDRASDAAYRRLRKDIIDGLECPIASVDMTKVAFARTCHLLSTVRVQDLASSRVALVAALTGDMLAGLSERLETSVEMEMALKLAVSEVLIGQMGALHQGRATSTTRHLLTRISESALAYLEGASRSDLCSQERMQVVTVAAAAHMQCRLALQARELELLAECPIETFVTQLSYGLQNKVCSESSTKTKSLTPHSRALSRSIALDMLRAETVESTPGKPDVRARVIRALDALFDAACLFLTPEDSLGQCPADLEIRGNAKLQSASVIRALVMATVDGDTNTILVAVSKAIALLYGERPSDPRKGTRVQHAFKLLSGLLQYAETYASATETKEKEAARQARTKILESLTRELTNRAGRTDWIGSFGGSIRLTGGWRFDLTGESRGTFWGPLSLPMGLGLHSPLSDRGVGFHLEASVIDIGQYVAFQTAAERVHVREPQVADLLSPSMSFGVYGFRDIPIFGAITAGYAPSYGFSPDAVRSLGSFNLGIAIGAYVPFFDIN